MDEVRALDCGISGFTNFFNACEIGDYNYLKYIFDEPKREWCK